MFNSSILYIKYYLLGLPIYLIPFKKKIQTQIISYDVNTKSAEPNSITQCKYLVSGTQTVSNDVNTKQAEPK